RSFTIATIVDASLWMLTTTIALVFALRGRIQQHSQWMTRSYAVAIVFLEARVILGLGKWSNPAMAGEMVVWLCVAISLPLADVAIHWKDLWATRAVTVRPIPAVQS